MQKRLSLRAAPQTLTQTPGQRRSATNRAGSPTAVTGAGMAERAPGADKRSVKRRGASVRAHKPVFVATNGKIVRACLRTTESDRRHNGQTDRQLRRLCLAYSPRSPPPTGRLEMHHSPSLKPVPRSYKSLQLRAVREIVAKASVSRALRAD